MKLKKNQLRNLLVRVKVIGTKYPNELPLVIVLLVLGVVVVVLWLWCCGCGVAVVRCCSVFWCCDF